MACEGGGEGQRAEGRGQRANEIVSVVVAGWGGPLLAAAWGEEEAGEPAWADEPSELAEGKEGDEADDHDDGPADEVVEPGGEELADAGDESMTFPESLEAILEGGECDQEEGEGDRLVERGVDEGAAIHAAGEAKDVAEHDDLAQDHGFDDADEVV